MVTKSSRICSADLGVGRDVVGGLAVVRALVQPPPDGLTVSGGVVTVATLEAEPRLARPAHTLLGHTLLSLKCNKEYSVTSGISR